MKKKGGQAGKWSQMRKTTERRKRLCGRTLNYEAKNAAAWDSRMSEMLLQWERETKQEAGWKFLRKFTYSFHHSISTFCPSWAEWHPFLLIFLWHPFLLIFLLCIVFKAFQITNKVIWVLLFFYSLFFIFYWIFFYLRWKGIFKQAMSTHPPPQRWLSGSLLCWLQQLRQSLRQYSCALSLHLSATI